MIALLLGAALAGPTLALVGATVHPVDGPPIDGATLLIGEDGRIADLSTSPPPAGVEVVDVAGKHIIPGLVDTHSHIGGSQLNDALAAVQPGLNAIDAFDPTHVSVRRARAGGITTVNVMPGSGKLMGGQTAYFKLRDTAVVDEMLFCERPEGDDAPPQRRAGICGGMKMANGTNPQGKGGDPRSRMGAAFLQRKALLEGRARAELAAKHVAVDDLPKRKRAAAKKDLKKLKPDIEAEALAQVARGERTVHFHTHRADDIVSVLRLQEEFGIDVVLHHVSECWKVPELLDGVAVSLILVDAPGGKEEADELYLSNAGVMEQAGARVALHTDDPITDSRHFLRMAGLAVRGGMTPEGALAALTLEPARMMRLDHRVGRIAPGLDADLVVLSGPPLSAWSHIEQTWIEGELVFDRSRPADRALAVGGDARSLESP